MIRENNIHSDFFFSKEGEQLGNFNCLTYSLKDKNVLPSLIAIFSNNERIVATNQQTLQAISNLAKPKSIKKNNSF